MPAKRKRKAQKKRASGAEVQLQQRAGGIQRSSLGFTRAARAANLAGTHTGQVDSADSREAPPPPGWRVAFLCTSETG